VKQKMGLVGALIICSVLMALPAWGSSADITIKLNDQLIVTDLSPRFENGRLLLPLRAVIEAIGGQLTWHEDSRIAVAALPGVTIAITDGATSPGVGSDDNFLAGIGTIIQDRMMVPLELITNAAGAKHSWDSENRIVFLVKENSIDFPAALLSFQQSIQWELWRMDQDLAVAAGQLGQTDLAGEPARRILRELAAQHPNAVDAATTDGSGIMKAIEPVNQDFEGSDISQQEHIKKMQNDRQPVLSESFTAVEGYQAIVLARPIFNSARQMIGFGSLLLKPELFGSGLGIDRWGNDGFVLLEANGQILFEFSEDRGSQDTVIELIKGSNPELAKKIAGEKSGMANYSNAADPQKRIAKRVAWTTVELHGSEWRLLQHYSFNTAESSSEKK